MGFSITTSGTKNITSQVFVGFATIVRPSIPGPRHVALGNIVESVKKEAKNEQPSLKDFLNGLL